MKYMNSFNCKFCFASRFALIAMFLLRCATASAEEAQTLSPEIRLSHCIVSLIDDVTLAAQEEGLLCEISVQEGSAIVTGEVVGRLDARQAAVQLKIAEGQFEVASKKCRNDVDVRLAKAEAEVKAFEHDNALEANKVVADVVGKVEVRRLALAHKEALLKAEKAERDLEVLVEERDVREAEIEAANLGVERRTIKSPIDGVVVQRFVDLGEWLKIGDPVCRVVRLDNLWVEGLLEAKNYRPDQVDGRPVQVDVELAGGKQERLRGEIVFVDPQIDGNGRFRVRARIENRRSERHWVLLPGQLAEMVVRPESPE